MWKYEWLSVAPLEVEGIIPRELIIEVRINALKS
jgi:hypothetical protein